MFDWLDKGVLAESSVIGTKESTAQVVRSFDSCEGTREELTTTTQHPYLFTTSLVALAQERGVKTVYATVTSLARTPSGSFTLTATCRDSHVHLTLPATAVVLAAGPWTGSLANQLLGSNGLGRAGKIDGSRAHSVVLRPGCERTLPAQALFTSIKTRESWSEPEIYVRSPSPSWTHTDSPIARAEPPRWNGLLLRPYRLLPTPLPRFPRHHLRSSHRRTPLPRWRSFALALACRDARRRGGCESRGRTGLLPPRWEWGSRVGDAAGGSVCGEWTQLLGDYDG